MGETVTHSIQVANCGPVVHAEMDPHIETNDEDDSFSVVAQSAYPLVVKPEETFALRLEYTRHSPDVTTASLRLGDELPLLSLRANSLEPWEGNGDASGDGDGDHGDGDG